MEEKLMTAFNFASPLPTDIVVYRYLHQLPEDYNDLTGEGLEKGFMSVSLREIPPERLSKAKFQYYLILYVLKGTVLLNLLFYNIREYEFLLPPGTRFKIYETSDIQKNDGSSLKIYSGLIC
jgi:hypothetical protein